MIPKKIFYVWGAYDDKKRDVLACMQSWRQNCQDYEIVEINENSVEYFDFQKELQQNKWFRTVFEKKMWAYVADYIRVKVLYDNGGIYLDTDVTVIKNFDKFLNDPAFVGIQCSGRWNYVEPAILGAQRGNKFLHEITEFYNDEIWTQPIYTMPQIFEHYLQRMYNIYRFPPKQKQTLIKTNDIYIYPERIFIPFEFGQKFSPECVEKDTHTIHWFGGSWLKPDIEYFLKNKHKNTSFISSKIKRYYVIKLFKYIPIICIYTKEKENKGMWNKITYIRLLYVIPLIKYIKNIKGFKIKLFDVISFLRYKNIENKYNFYLFNFIPLLKIRRK